MTNRVFNFSAGPGALPLEVLKEAQEDFLSYKGNGLNVMEMSHRSKTYDEIFTTAQADLRKLLNISDEYEILFLQGGATLQFSMVALNLMPPTNKADYIVTGGWSEKAVKEAKRVGKVNIAASSKETNFNRIPKQDELKLTPGASYVHYTSNNTLYGTQFRTEPEVGDVPLVCDTSSDMLHKPLDVNKYALIYAGAQKNLGPAGASLVIVRKDMLERSSGDLHTYLNYKVHCEKDSMYNTPATYSVYMIGLVFKWLLNMGGLDVMHKRNLDKANLIYNAIDNSDGYYKGHAEKEDRSLMNLCFTMQNEDLEKKFVAEAGEAGFISLKGHRSVGGLRTSIYNAFPVEGVEKFVQFMEDFKKNN